ncbi:hypothetical protein Pcinc_024855 [Petrolisthes cinctipes]|uniref:Condensation domain-containing protein n=1 Tax=Petrolisthes cinctipes TaxID=88211 RepID=A0AAE1FA05_PETCI|nr:hypothetical protein Pcinc_024855 [Petrolisthes cinctipes]
MSAKELEEEEEKKEKEEEDQQMWLRPAGDKEEYFEVGHQLGFFQTNYNLSICSTKPLDHTLFTKVLTHLFWKVPVLRVCLGRRQGQLWLKKMRGCILDLKVLNEGELEKERERLMSHTFNTDEGPLWCMSVVVPEQPQESHHHYQPQESHHHYQPQESHHHYQPQESHHHYQPQESHHHYQLLFGTHHTIADGFTNIRICHMLHEILNDILTGRTVDDKEQLGQHLDDHLAKQLYEEKNIKLLQDPELLSKCREKFLEATITHPHLLDLLPSPRDDCGRSHYVKQDLDENLTKAFMNKCKCEGVSFHSGFTGVVNAAIIKILEDAGKGQLQYNFVASHDLSMRRYYPRNLSQVLGTHLPLFGFLLPFKVSKDFVDTFWPHIKSFHQDLHHELLTGGPMQAVALRLMQKSKSENYAEYFRTSGSPNYYYAISNLGDVTSLMPGEGEVVKVKGLNRVSTVRANATIMCFFIHTYKGICSISLVYSSRYMDHHIARKLLDQINTTFTEVCSM